MFLDRSHWHIGIVVIYDNGVYLVSNAQVNYF